jgi:hypothetical protein
MDDYEKLQWELQELYTVYLERFRNLEYLEMELDHLDRAEQEKMEDADRHLKKMQRKMRDEVRCVGMAWTGCMQCGVACVRWAPRASGAASIDHVAPPLVEPTSACGSLANTRGGTATKLLSHIKARERERAFCGSCAASGGAGVVVRAHRFPPSNAALWARWHAFDSLGTLTTQNPHPNRRCAF